MSKVENIRCMLLPLAQDRLLLPNVAVAEVIAYVEPSSTASGESETLGEIDWRGVKVPILSFERLCQLDEAENSLRDRIAILYHPEGDENKPYLGVKLKDIPRSFLADANDLQDEVITINQAEYILNQLSHEGERVFIPNLDKLFNHLA